MLGMIEAFSYKELEQPKFKYESTKSLQKK